MTSLSHIHLLTLRAVLAWNRQLFPKPLIFSGRQNSAEPEMETQRKMAACSRGKGGIQFRSRMTAPLKRRVGRGRTWIKFRQFCLDFLMYFESPCRQQWITASSQFYFKIKCWRLCCVCGCSPVREVGTRCCRPARSSKSNLMNSNLFKKPKSLFPIFAFSGQNNHSLHA